MKFRYVLSAPSYIGLAPTKESKETPDTYKLFVDLTTDCVRRVKRDLTRLDSSIEIDVDILFNAFTEKLFGVHLRKYDNFGLSKMYADSGGLQIVTIGKSITSELKKEIYKVQSVADFAMCFDEIPTRSLTTGNTKNSRMDVGNKMFYYNDMKQCALATAENIKEQCEVLSSINDTTNVFYIVQGNTHTDMVEWFHHGSTVLKDYSRIGGLALADTCMGTGQRESVEMFMAYKKIHDDFGSDVIKKHVHLLGIGSVSRLMPLLYCSKNLLPNDLTVSFDSTSISCAYAMGTLKNLDSSEVKKHEYKSYFTDIVRYFEEDIRKHYPEFDSEVFIEHYTANVMSKSKTINNPPHDKRFVVQAHIVSTLMYQLFPFFRKFLGVISSIGNQETHLNYLSKSKTYQDSKHWLKYYGKYVDSKKILRHGNSLAEFF